MAAVDVKTNCHFVIVIFVIVLRVYENTRIARELGKVCMTEMERAQLHFVNKILEYFREKNVNACCHILREH